MADKKKPAKKAPAKKKAAPKKEAAPKAPKWEKIDVGQGMWRMKKGDINIGPFYCDKSSQKAMDKADGILIY